VSLQGSGLTYQSNQMMMAAHGMMREVDNLKTQANNMYNLSNQLNGSIGVWQLYASMMAANVNALTTLNKPMEP